ncbi:hypothetical protein K438DRAFT_1823680 [Mycena galopus ATCC 62051]|nr:hypothetical protein K438DRAFT_1823680 [Mycena galopus ATCC 62051]
MRWSMGDVKEGGKEKRCHRGRGARQATRGDNAHETRSTSALSRCRKRRKNKVHDSVPSLPAFRPSSLQRKKYRKEMKDPQSPCSGFHPPLRSLVSCLDLFTSTTPLERARTDLGSTRHGEAACARGHRPDSGASLYTPRSVHTPPPCPRTHHCDEARAGTAREYKARRRDTTASSATGPRFASPPPRETWTQHHPPSSLSTPGRRTPVLGTRSPPSCIVPSSLQKQR